MQQISIESSGALFGGLPEASPTLRARRMAEAAGLEPVTSAVTEMTTIVYTSTYEADLLLLNTLKKCELTA